MFVSTETNTRNVLSVFFKSAITAESHMQQKELIEVILVTLELRKMLAPSLFFNRLWTKQAGLCAKHGSLEASSLKHMRGKTSQLRALKHLAFQPFHEWNQGPSKPTHVPMSWLKLIRRFILLHIGKGKELTLEFSVIKESHLQSLNPMGS